ncbi:MAG: T9SS type A sorting domain-containing protein [Bacteroidetes bacterium]|nr:T9SS type A sorting domain-containing protein [Bacteroidota bacterium]
MKHSTNNQAKTTYSILTVIIWSLIISFISIPVMATTYNTAPYGTSSDNECRVSQLPHTSLSSGDVNIDNTVSLISFKAEQEEDYVYIFWKTASEKNNDYFTIERSLNGIDFEKIGTIRGERNSLEVVQYSLEDNNPLPGTIYYRLKQTDFDGNFSYFPMVTIDYKHDQKSGLHVYPNTGQENSINREISGMRGEYALISIVNLSGEEMYSNIVQTESGSLNITCRSNSLLSTGIYVVRVDCGGYIYTEK